jgi:hypothetical protein
MDWLKNIIYKTSLFKNLKYSIQKKSKLIISLLFITFFLAVSAIIAVIFAFIDIHFWSNCNSKSPSTQFVPFDKIVVMNGQQYVPIQILCS